MVPSMRWSIEGVRARYDRWWGPEKAGPLVYAPAPRDGALKKLSPPGWVRGDPWWGWVHDWLSAREEGRAGGMEELLEATLDAFAATRHAGDAFPRVNVNYGPGSLAACLTGHLKFEPGTTWFELPGPMAWDDILALELGEDNRWWRDSRELTSFLARESGGRYTVGYPDLGGLMDVLASLRTSNQLLEDVVEEPELVKEAMRLVLARWHECYDGLTRILAEAGQEGTGAWMELWCRERWYPVQCDIAAMLSPAMFGEFVLPTLSEHCARLDRAVFHWDGPGQLRHLNHLLGIECLAGIQWVPGSGQPGQEDPKWFPYYERILRAGKRLILNYMPPAAVPGMASRFGGTGLYMGAMCGNEGEAAGLARSMNLPIED